jgi:hypothetical protein
LAPVAPAIALITQRSLVQIQPPQPGKSMGYGTHAVARWFFSPTFVSRSPLKHWSSANGPSGRLRTVRCGPRWCDSRGDIPCISRQGVDMTGPRDALAGRVIPPAGFAARTYSIARYARTAPSTTSAICRARSPILRPDSRNPEDPHLRLVTALSRPKRGFESRWSHQNHPVAFVFSRFVGAPARTEGWPANALHAPPQLRRGVDDGPQLGLRPRAEATGLSANVANPQSGVSHALRSHQVDGAPRPLDDFRDEFDTIPLLVDPHAEADRDWQYLQDAEIARPRCAELQQEGPDDERSNTGSRGV